MPQVLILCANNFSMQVPSKVLETSHVEEALS